VRIQHDRGKMNPLCPLANVIGRNTPGKNEPGTQKWANAQNGKNTTHLVSPKFGLR